jgi:hypothetical protein
VVLTGVCLNHVLAALQALVDGPDPQPGSSNMLSAGGHGHIGGLSTDVLLLFKQDLLDLLYYQIALKQQTVRHGAALLVLSTAVARSILATTTSCDSCLIQDLLATII